MWTIDDRDGVTVAQLNDTTGAHRHFAHCNTLYHVYALTDETGTLVEAYEYDAYGKATVFTGDGSDNIWFTDDDDKASRSGKDNPYQYTGQRYDPETGWMYYKYRFYSISLGRFISRDRIGYMDGYNLYEYIHSNAINMMDALGLATNHSDPWPVVHPGPVDPFGKWLPESMRGECKKDDSLTCNSDEPRAQASQLGPFSAIDGRKLANQARDLTNSLPGPGRYRDAMRHCVWSCKMSKSKGPEKAKIMTDLHEICTPVAKQDPGEEVMDLWNNAVGRQHGTSLHGQRRHRRGKRATTNCYDLCNQSAFLGGLILNPQYGLPQPLVIDQIVGGY